MWRKMREDRHCLMHRVSTRRGRCVRSHGLLRYHLNSLSIISRTLYGLIVNIGYWSTLSSTRLRTRDRRSCHYLRHRYTSSTICRSLYSLIVNISLRSAMRSSSMLRTRDRWWTRHHLRHGNTSAAISKTMCRRWVDRVSRRERNTLSPSRLRTCYRRSWHHPFKMTVNNLIIILTWLSVVRWYVTVGR